MSDRSWQDGHWRSADDLRLHYRDYPGDPAKAALVCLPGLTRNARDFAEVAERLSGRRRVIVVELRGRGQSEWSPDLETYAPGVYVKDLRLLFEQLALPRFLLFGTSLGGILTMILAAGRLPGLSGALINDIGPLAEEAGLDHIRAYLRAPQRWPDWDSAAAATAETHRAAYPDFEPADWRAMAERLFREEKDSAIVVDHDPAIAIPFARPIPAPAEPWRLIEGLRDIPSLLVRGGLSDLLSVATAEDMARRLPEMEVVTLPRVGHPPLLTEQAAEQAIDHLLARVDAAL